MCDGDADCGTAGEKCGNVAGTRVCLSEQTIEADGNIVAVDGDDSDDGDVDSDGGGDTDGEADGESSDDVCRWG